MALADAMVERVQPRSHEETDIGISTKLNRRWWVSVGFFVTQVFEKVQRRRSDGVQCAWWVGTHQHPAIPNFDLKIKGHPIDFETGHFETQYFKPLRESVTGCTVSIVLGTTLLK